MKRRWPNGQRGEADIGGIVVLLVLIIIIVLSPKNGPSESYWSSSSGTTISSAGDNNQRSGTTVESQVTLGSGNAPYSYQPYEEYITIENRGRAAIDITGWQLKNGKDKRTYNTGGTLQRFSADIAAIPALMLEPDERAIITTGSVGVQSPYKITNFKENICTGYIETHPDYAFTPPLSQNCPRPSEEPGIENLDVQCRDFIKNLSSCKTPEFDVKTPDGLGSCSTCVNGKILSSQCATFIKEHFNYKGCVANHANDPKFYGRTWRIFLGRGWEMWADGYETIELFNQFGQLMDYENY